MSTTMFRYQLKQNYAYSKVKLVCGQSSAQVRVAPHSIFSQVKQIHLKVDEFNTKFLELVQKGEVLVSPEKSSQFVKRCQQAFDTEIILDVAQVGVNLMLSNNDQDTKTLDFLDLKDLLSIITFAFDKTGIKLHSKVIRKLKGYIKNSMRSKGQKQNLQTICKFYKQTENLQEDDQLDSAPVVEKKQSRKQQKLKYKKVQEYIPTTTSKTQQANTVKRVEKKPVNETQNIKASEDDESQEDADQYKDYVYKKSRGERKGRKSQSGRNYTPQQPDQMQQYGTKGRPSSRSSNNRNTNSRNSNRSGDKRNDFRGASAGKQKIDPKIMLGITGDTQFGWRQRNRPTRYPPRNTLDIDEGFPQTNSQKTRFKKQEGIKKQSQYSKSSKDGERARKPSRQQKTQQNKSIQETTQASVKSVTKQVNQEKENVQQSTSASFAEAGEAKRVFTFPKDGKKFDFKKLKNNFMLFINGAFWIKYTQGTLSITKGENGYIRECKIDFIQNGLMGEGLTLTLDGNSNIQDGGDTMGTPKIEDFTGSVSQFFHIITLQAYVPK